MMLLGLGFPPAGRRAGPAWPHIKAVWAADFLNDRYAMRRRASSSLLTTTRSSLHLLADASGVYQTFTANKLARVNGTGAYIGAQVTPLIKDNTDASTARWSNGYNLTRTKLVGTRLGIFSRVAVASNGATYHRISTGAFIPAVAPHLVTIFWEPGTSGRFHLEINHNGGVYLISGLPGGLTGAVFKDSPGAVSGLTDVLTADGITRKTTFKWTPVGATSSAIDIGPDSNTSGQTIVICGCDVQPVGYETPFITSNGASVSTRYASDVRATAMDWFGAVGLGSGASELVGPNWSHIGDGVERPLFEYSDGTANNLIKGYIDASDKPALKIIAGGVVQTTTTLAASIAKGRKPLAFGWSSGGGYVADSGGNVATFSAITLPAVTQKRLGGSVAGNYLNDIIEAAQCCRLLNQAEAQHWAQAA